MIQMKTLVAEENDRDVAQLLALLMKKAGCEVTSPGKSYEETGVARRGQRGLLIVDLLLPGADSLDLCEEVDRLIGLELEAEDYPPGRLDLGELLLRVRVILRSGGSDRQPGTIFKRSGLEIDFEGHRISVEGREIVLTAVQFKLLAELVNHPGKVLDRDYLLGRVWGYNFEGYARSVDTQISRLRQKLLSRADWIETVRGVGYRFRG